jgi:hypothetical protein
VTVNPQKFFKIIDIDKLVERFGSVKVVLTLSVLMIAGSAQADYYLKDGHTYSDTCVDENNKVIATHQPFQEIDTVCFVATGPHSGIWGVYVPRGKFLGKK